jgi:hypothetical protein
MFREFFKTKIGRQPGECCDKVAYDPATNPAAKSIMNAFGGAPKAPVPPPAPADVSPDTGGGSLGSRITAGLNSMIGG